VRVHRLPVLQPVQDHREAVRTGPSRGRTVALLLATVLLAGGCAASDRGGAPTPTPAPTPPTAPTTPGPDAGTPDPVVVHAVRTAPTTFFVEPVLVAAPAAADDSAEAQLLRALEALVVLRPSEPGLSTSVPEGTVVLGVTIGTVVEVDLGGTFGAASGGSAQEITFAQQLTHTVLAAIGPLGVRLRVDGALVDELWGHLDWSEPLTADPFSLSPVTIEVPGHAAEVAAGELIVTGQATVFEATVVVAAYAADGTLVAEGFVTATEGGPGRGTWEWRVTLSVPGEYRLEAGASDPSGGEGPPPFVAIRTVRVIS
jgi:hypothetical protein